MHLLKIKVSDKPRRLLSILPFSTFIPIALQFCTNFIGNDLAEAVSRAMHSLFKIEVALAFWIGLAIFNLLLLRFLKPLFRPWCGLIDCSNLNYKDASKALWHLDHLGQFLITLSIVINILVSISTRLPTEFGGPSPKMFYNLLSAGATGLMVGVLIWVIVDNVLFTARSNLMASNPDLKPRYQSLFIKMLVIIITVLIFLSLQMLDVANLFFSNSQNLEAFQPPLTPNNSDHMMLLFDPAMAEEMKAPMSVFYVRMLTFALFIGVLMIEIKKMIAKPLKIIQDRLTGLNSDKTLEHTEIQILQNDEYAPVYKEINMLIQRQKSELISSRNQLDSLTNSAPDPIIVYDTKGDIRRFNPAAESYFGMSASEVIGQNVSTMIQLEDSSILFGNEPNTVDDSCGTTRGLVRMSSTGPDGILRNFEANASREECQGDVEYTVVLRDIESHLELENNLIKARQAAEEASRMKSEFLATMSHELRTPLNAVLGFTQLLSTDRNLTSSQLDKISTISRSGEHLLALINDILDISKIEAGKTELHLTAFDLPQFVKDIQEMFELKCKKKGLTLYVENVGDLPRYVEGDLGKLRQVVINLVGNAVKFTKEGGIGIAVGREGDLFRFSITDSGRGIPQAEQSSILQPFIQSSLTDNEGGTGLGLAISSRFITMMGGEISLQSEVGKGSVFSFTVALRDTDQVPEAARVEANPVAVKSGAEKPILIVDDKSSNRLILKEMLEAIGFVTMEAENGREAVERTREVNPLVVLMDIRMPEMDGYDAVRIIRADPQLASTRVFALTASAFRHDEEEILASGFDGFLAKPFKRSALFALIRDKTKIELVYETAIPTSPSPIASAEALDWSSFHSQLNPEFYKQLQLACTINDFSAVHSIATDIQSALPELSRLLHHFAAEFNEDGLADILQRLERSRP